ncbi:YncE family protein [Novosphingobium sp. HK4-1]|uniref:YncE family protein n=2 Tax=Novosphingobium mangrovi (ex Huang et al. 2023) TaxID=2976432 RepID=A0ABT2I4H8_9SPHN|nr:YncE family protein [Novosphingobium mangrovi (ex Huang et al. 2023)]MCT2399538.1 YncE family protein [Novosphingobium mangrovi (ex Huang et al. 2023)]
MFLTATAGLAAISPPAHAEGEQVITVPGFADFLAVDGETVWATNRGRIERWSREGKLAEVPMARPCGTMAITQGALWAADCSEGTLKRIDLETAKITATIPTGIANPKGELNVVAGAGSVWVASDNKGVVSRIDPDTNTVVATVTVDPGTWYLAFGYGSVWAVSATEQSLQRIDPETNAVTVKTPLGKEPGFLAAGSGAVWVQEQGDGTVARIDSCSGKVTGRIKVGDNLKWGDIDTGDGKVWLRTTDDQTFVVIDGATQAIEARIGAAAGSGALRYTAAGVWTTAHDVHTLTWWPASGFAGKSDD